LTSGLLLIVAFKLTVKRFSADLSPFDASVICTQLERNNNFQHRKGTQTMTTPTYNRLNKDDAIVLLVDHQTGLISLVQDFSPNEFKNNVLALADLAKFFNLPTILTTSFEQGPNGPLVPELKEMFPDAPYIARPGQINAWDNEDFVKAIKATGRKQIIIAGVVTDVCVAFPTLSALAEGFDVFVVTDASGTFNTTVQQAAWSRMTQAGAQMMNWFSVACELHRDWRNDIEGLGNLLSQRIPNYRNLMNSYSALTAQQK
jgi:nicotinamidase-related amidase